MRRRTTSAAVPETILEAGRSERNYWREVPLQDEQMDAFVQDEIDRIAGLYEEIGS